MSNEGDWLVGHLASFINFTFSIAVTVPCLRDLQMIISGLSTKLFYKYLFLQYKAILII